jgi:hypothetical protein
MWYYDALISKEETWKLRSKTFQGIARAMADQWSRPGIIQSKLF